MRQKKYDYIIAEGYNDTNPSTGYKVCIAKNDILRIWDGSNYRSIYLTSKIGAVQPYIKVKSTFNELIEIL